jgi:hypothetical protein
MEKLMSVLIPGTCLSILEASDIQFEAHERIAGSRYYRSVLHGYEEFEEWWGRTETAIKASSSVSTSAGLAALILSSQEDNGFDHYHSLHLSSPANFSRFDIWALIHATILAEVRFLRTCSRPNTEVGLTAALIQVLQDSADEVNDRYRKYLSISGAGVFCGKLELQVKNRESTTGGDFGLLLEWIDSTGSVVICPILFQAKRTGGLNADISQSNKKVGPQLKVLSRSKCNPSYIFYNCATNSVIDMPRLPTVKPVATVIASGNTVKCSTVDDALSLSTYLLNLISTQNCFVTRSRKEALTELLDSASEEELLDVISFSVDETALRHYQADYSAYRRAKEPRNKPRNSGDDFTP